MTASDTTPASAAPYDKPDCDILRAVSSLPATVSAIASRAHWSETRARRVLKRAHRERVVEMRQIAADNGYPALHYSRENHPLWVRIDRGDDLTDSRPKHLQHLPRLRNARDFTHWTAERFGVTPPWVTGFVMEMARAMKACLPAWEQDHFDRAQDWIHARPKATLRRALNEMRNTRTL